MSTVWLLGKKKESKIYFVGFVDCVDLISFRSCGICGFFRLFGSVVCLAFILELYSVAYNSTIMFNFELL